MIAVEAYRDRAVAVFGLGRSGLTAAQALAAGGTEVRAWDDSAERRAKADSVKGLRLLEPKPENWTDVAALVLSPGVPLHHPAPHPSVRMARKLGIEILGDIELFARARPDARVVAITGTNGKSTTTALLGHLLNCAGHAAAVGANLGRPVLDLDPLEPEGVYVLELSSYQIDLTRNLNPAVAVLLNLSPDHLDRHGDMAGYVAAKRRLFEMAGDRMVAVVGIDDPDSEAIARSLEAEGRRVVPVAVGRVIEKGVFVVDAQIHVHRDGRAVPLAALDGIESLRGQHNWQNAAAACAAALELGLADADLRQGLASFPGLAHRMQLLTEIDGIRFVNDSKATNADAAARALAAYDHIHWIAGGLPKEGGIVDLEPFFPRIEHAYLIGEAAPAFAGTLKGKVFCEISGELVTAVVAAYRGALAAGGAGRTVLLSPACASFDQFASFEARGATFARLVDELAKETKRDAG